jgi:ubiquinone/menaquinone biosynthesis C-methylase UbiE
VVPLSVFHLKKISPAIGVGEPRKQPAHEIQYICSQLLKKKETVGGKVHDSKKFDPKKLAKLNDPKRLEYLNPDVIWEKIGIRNPEILVDIGAGTGLFASLFRKKIKKGKVYACDISQEMLGWMNDNLPAVSEGTVIPVKMAESSVPLPDSVADLVYMINLHHELDEPLRILEESWRLLRRGGKLAVIDWKKQETPEGPPIEIRVTEETIESQMRKSGFTNVGKYAVLPYHHFLVGEKKA